MAGSLEEQLLACLADGEETTLLLQQMVGPPGLEESELLKLLWGLEKTGLVSVSKWENPNPIEDPDERGIPELTLGREEVLWWKLTENGRNEQEKYPTN